MFIKMLHSLGRIVIGSILWMAAVWRVQASVEMELAKRG
jgi:hypothetical protein